MEPSGLRGVGAISNEVAATFDSGGPERPSVEWLILQRLDDLRRSQDELAANLTRRVDELRDDLTRRMDEVRDDLTRRMDEVRDDLTRRMDVLESRVSGVESQLGRLDGRIDSVRNWSLGLLLLAILGLLAKLLIPGA